MLATKKNNEILLRPDKRNLDVKHDLSYVTVVNNFRMFLYWKSRLLKLAFLYLISDFGYPVSLP